MRLSFFFALALALAAEIKTIPHGADIKASVRLYKANGKIGRATPFFDGYRPQVKFPSAHEEITCTIHVPKGKVDPGETADVVMVCLADVLIDAEKASFTIHEGGRMVGAGTVQ